MTKNRKWFKYVKNFIFRTFLAWEVAALFWLIELFNYRTTTMSNVLEFRLYYNLKKQKQLYFILNIKYQAKNKPISIILMYSVNSERFFWKYSYHRIFFLFRFTFVWGGDYNLHLFRSCYSIKNIIAHFSYVGNLSEIIF